MKPACSVIRNEILFIAVLFQLILYVQGAEIIYISENKIEPLGGSVEFSCVVHNPINYTLLWTKVSNNRLEQSPLAVKTELLNANKRFVVNYDEKTSNYTLKIKELEQSDVGFYQCQISVDVNDKVTEEVRLDINRAPQIISALTDTPLIFEDELIVLSCQADGYPEPEIIWKRENNAIFGMGGTSYRGNVLKIPNADKTDRGIYYCIADNGVEPAAEAQVKVNVEFAPIVDAIRPRIGQAKGHNAKLQCHVEAYPAPIITWLKNGHVIAKETPHSSTDEFIHTRHINLIGPEDYGFYTCKVENKHGIAETIIQLYETEIPWTFSD